MLCPENVLLVQSYLGQENDRILLDLIPFLVKLASKEDVRDVRKRYYEYLSIVNSIPRKEEREGPQKEIALEVTNIAENFHMAC